MTPAEHRDAAVQLLTDCEDDYGDSPSQQLVLTQAAIAHALLGLLEVQIAKPSAAQPLRRYGSEIAGLGASALTEMFDQSSNIKDS